MKSYSIGRDPSCQVVINDPSNVVSRHHATLNVDGFKMTIIDNSANGTYINGVKIGKGVSVPVTRKDVISFADAAVLDWNKIPNPMATLIIVVVSVVLALSAIAGAAYFICQIHSDKEAEAIKIAELAKQSKNDMTMAVEEIKNDISHLKNSLDSIGQVVKKLDNLSSKKEISSKLNKVTEELSEVKTKIKDLDIASLENGLIRVQDNISDGSADAKTRLDDFRKSVDSVRESLKEIEKKVSSVEKDLSTLPDKKTKTDSTKPAKEPESTKEENKDTTVISPVIL